MTSGARITAIRVSSSARDLQGRVWNPALRWTVKHAVFIEIDTDDGITGLGECWCFDAAPDALIAYIRTDIAWALVGETMAEARCIMQQQWARATLTARHGLLASVHSGIDIALWDASARTDGLPLWRALKADGPGECAVYASGGLYSEGKRPSDLAEELAGFAARGFTAVKLKVGGAPRSEDVARVNAVRDRIGPGTGLMIDAASSYDRIDAEAFFDSVKACNIDAFQAPIPPSDLSGMRRLRRRGIAVMAGEAEYREEIFDDLIESQAVAILQVAPIACGGPSRVLELARRCRAAGIPMSLETSSTAVATLAALHLGAALRQIAHVEVHQVHDVLFAEAGIASPHRPAGRMAPPDAPGLGFSLPPGSTVQAFEITSPARKSARATRILKTI